MPTLTYVHTPSTPSTPELNVMLKGFLNLAASYCTLKLYKEAEVWYKEALKIAPRNAAVLNNYAILFLKQGLFSQGILLLTQAKSISPYSKIINKNLCKAYKLAYSHQTKILKNL
jgi:Tfp pilus assembly protein PilF